MRLLKQAVTGLGIVVVVVAIAAVVAPKVLAVAATLVRDVDHPARSTFQAFFPVTCNSNTQSCSSGFTVPSTTVSGQPVAMLVIDYVSGVCAIGSQPLLQMTNYPLNELIPLVSANGNFGP